MPLTPLDRFRSLAGGVLNKPGLPIAVDFGVASLKVLQVAAGAKADDPLALVAAAALDTPDELLADAPGRLAYQLDQLPRLIRSAGAGGFRGKRAVCAIPAGQTFCKHMQFPRTEGLPVAALVKAAVPAQIGCHPDALLYRHVEVDTSAGGAGPGTGKSEVICLAASRQLVARLMDSLRAAKLEPVGMLPECMATIRAFDMITRRAEDENLTTLYLDLGFGTTKVMVTHGRRLVFVKTIHLGGAQFDQAVAKRQGCNTAVARARRCNSAQVIPAVAGAPAPALVAAATAEAAAMPILAAAIATHSAVGVGAVAGGESIVGAAATMLAEERRQNRVAPGLTPDLATQPPARIADDDIDLTEPLETLTDEVAMCLRYHDSIFPGRRVNRSIFVGGEARHRGLCQHIARTLRLPAQVADPLARLARTGGEPAPGVDLGAPQPGWTVAFGLVLAPTDL